MDKFNEIEKRRNNWRVQKLCEETKLSEKENNTNNYSNYHDSNSIYTYTGNDNDYDDDFLNRFGEKIALRIREDMINNNNNNDNIHNSDKMNDMNDEKMKNIINNRIVSYFEHEINTTNCKICYENYNDNDRTPILLFPCGHTFCKSCITIHTKNTSSTHTDTTVHSSIYSNRHISASDNRGRNRSSSSSSFASCPMCRANIERSAINLSLKEIIEGVKQKRVEINSNIINNSLSSKCDLFNNQTNMNHTVYNSNNNVNGGRSSSSGSNIGNYNARFEDAVLRHSILLQELSSLQLSYSNTGQKLDKLNDASIYLNREKERVVTKISELEEEKKLINEHLLQQEEKIKVLELEMKKGKDRINIVRNSVSNIEKEMEKLELLKDYKEE